MAILAHWVHFHKAGKRESWNALQLTVVFITPLIYFIPATLLAQAPVVDGRLDYEVLFESNKTLIYITVLLFAGFTMAQNYLVYNRKDVFIYAYYSLAMVLVSIALAADSKSVDLGLAVAIFISEMLNHYVMKLS